MREIPAVHGRFDNAHDQKLLTRSVTSRVVHNTRKCSWLLERRLERGSRLSSGRDGVAAKVVRRAGRGQFIRVCAVEQHPIPPRPADDMLSDIQNRPLSARRRTQPIIDVQASQRSVEHGMRPEKRRCGIHTVDSNEPCQTSGGTATGVTVRPMMPFSRPRTSRSYLGPLVGRTTYASEPWAGATGATVTPAAGPRLAWGL
jgi:hypothetical protein